jgi:Icc-related predicted phosphoesterase
MVKLQLMSDIHIEMLSTIPNPLDYITPVADILVLAGDIGRLHKYEQLDSFLKRLCPLFHTVLYVPGNHEYYRVDGMFQKNMFQLKQDLYKIKSEIDNLHILDRNSFIIGDTCIFGCTLWSKPEVEVPRFIVKIRNMTTEKYDWLYERDSSYIKHMVNYCNERNLKAVCVTHHAPTYDVVYDRKRFKYISIYASDLDYLLHKKYIHTWIFGHIHENYDYVTDGGTRLVTNQKGKEKDGIRDFAKDKVIIV